MKKNTEEEAKIAYIKKLGYIANWQKENREKKRLYSRNWHKNNPEKSKEVKDRFIKGNPTYFKEYHLENKGRWGATNKESLKKYRDTHKEKTRAYESEYYKNNPNAKLAKSGRSIRLNALKKQGVEKTIKYIESIGCTIDFYRVWIENQFTEGMNWENHGEWHIDEKRPCSSFDLSDKTQYLECFNYRNSQPLWAIDNLKKSSFYNGIYHKHFKSV